MLPRVRQLQLLRVLQRTEQLLGPAPPKGCLARRVEWRIIAAIENMLVADVNEGSCMLNVVVKSTETDLGERNYPYTR